jgi:hypothetical protein
MVFQFDFQLGFSSLDRALSSFIKVLREICFVVGEKKVNKALVSGWSTRAKERSFFVFRDRALDVFGGCLQPGCVQWIVIKFH